jgi:hypothetical protein
VAKLLWNFPAVRPICVDHDGVVSVHAQRSAKYVSMAAAVQFGQRIALIRIADTGTDALKRCDLQACAFGFCRPEVDEALPE